MSLADLIKRRTGHTSHTITPIGVTATSPVVTDGHTSHTSHTTKNVEPEREPQKPTEPDWLAWIDERCPLLLEDRTHVVRGLFRLHPRLQQRLAERYVETWQTAANAEPLSHKRDNVGRRAANMIVTRLLKGNDIE